MGCILNTATSTPLNAPKSIATTQAARKATIIGACRVSGRELLPQSTRRSTLPAIAVVAPTLMSCPPVAAVTSVIPIARIASSEPLSRIVIKKPDRTGLPALLYPSSILKNEGSIIRLNRNRIRRAASGIITCFLSSLPKKLEAPAFFVSFVCIICHLRQSYS